MSTLSPFELGSAIGKATGNVSKAISEPLQKRKDINTIDEVLAGIESPEQFNDAMTQILQSVSPQNQEMAKDVLQRKYNQMQNQRLAQYYENEGLSSEIAYLPKEIQAQTIKNIQMQRDAQRKEKLQEELATKKAQIKSEWESPEIKKYRESLGNREETATQLQPALENARQYQDSPSRFIPGSAANKALKDVAIRAFSFYKPLFGGRLTQKEFLESLSALSANKALPGGFQQALNLIDSMVAQATNESDQFNKYLDEGNSPLQARRRTLKDMRDNAGEIFNIIQGNKVPKGTKQFVINGEIYNIPEEQVEEFKKDMGI